MRLRVGLAAWSNSHFDNALYFPGTRHDEYLPRYASLFDCAEADVLHHQFPRAAELEAWVEATPDGFTFLPKMHKSVTHDGQVQSGQGFLRGLEPLRRADRLGPVLLQFPPSLEQEAGWDDLVRLLRLGPPGTFAVEVRNTSWFTPAFEELLSDHEAPLVWSTFPGAFAPPWATGERGYIRFTGKHGPRRGRHVTVDDRPKEVAEIAKRLRQAPWKESFVIVTNPFEGNAVDSLPKVARGLGLDELAAQLRREPGRPLLADAPLPPSSQRHNPPRPGTSGQSTLSGRPPPKPREGSHRPPPSASAGPGASRKRLT